MKNIFALLISIILLILAVIFTLQNAQITEVNYFFWQTSASLSLILFLTFSMGILFAVAAILPAVFSLRAALNQLRREKLHEQSHQTPLPPENALPPVHKP